MRQLFLVFLLGVLHSAGAADPARTSVPVPRNTTVCELARTVPNTTGAFVLVRAQLQLDHHWGGIVDDRCPNEIVFLEWMEGGPSMAFCELDFGCPANTKDFRIMATFIGYYYRADNERGRLRLKELRDAKRTRK